MLTRLKMDRLPLVAQALFQVNRQVWKKVCNSTFWEVDNQVCLQVWDPIDDQILDQVLLALHQEPI